MSKTKSVIITVAVRLKSARLPRKALLDLGGKSLIERLTERVAQATIPEAIYWCTSTHQDDDLLEQLVDKTDAWIYRGDELDVMSRFIEIGWSCNAKTVVRVTGDNPLTDPVMMDHMLTLHAANNAEYTFTDDLPHGTRCEIIEMDALEKAQGLVEDPDSSEYMTHMLRRPDVFNVLEVKSPYLEIHRPDLRLTVDFQEDADLITAIYEAFDGSPPPLKDIISWIDRNPHIAEMNKNVQQKEPDSHINTQLMGDA